MINKLAIYDSRPNSTGHSLIHPVNRLYTTGGLDKTASSLLPEVVDYLSTLEDPGKDEARAVITALSAYDTFGPNKNGDAFFREDLLRGWDYNLPQVKGKIPMYQSFEHFARPYRHHNNRPESEAYGKILKAFWNPKMDRVELVVSVSRNNASDLVDQMENYGDLSTSMGFKAVYDQCLICGNKASRRVDYCDHARRQMLQVLPDGRIVAVRNPEGRFFDISFVSDPADLTSRAVWVNRVLGGSPKRGVSAETLAKTASSLAQNLAPQEEYLDVYLSSDLACANGVCEIITRDEFDLQKTASSKIAEEKNADITKRVTSDSHTLLSPEHEEEVREALGRMREEESPLSEDSLISLSKEGSLNLVLSGLFAAGISPQPREAQYLALACNDLQKEASYFHRNGILFNLETIEPIDYPIDAPEGFEKVAQSLALDTDLMKNRSLNQGWIPYRLEKRASNMGYNPYVQGVNQGRTRTSMAGAILDRRELNRYERDIEEPSKAGKLRYALGLLMGASWAIRRRQFEELARRDPGLLARMALGPEATPEDIYYRRGRRILFNRGPIYSDGPSPQNLSSLTMTAPLTSFMGGIGSPQHGLMESLLKESSLQKVGMRYLREDLEPLRLRSLQDLKKQASYTKIEGPEDMEMIDPSLHMSLILAHWA